MKRIKNLKQALKKPLSVNDLWIEDGNLRETPDFSIFENLEKLYISAPLKLIPKGIEKLKKLKTLKLENWGKGLHLEDRIGEIENLEELELYSKFKNQIPDTISNLKQLKSLTIRSIGYNITELPESFQNLNNLEKLILTGTSYKKIPKFIGELKKINTLHLDNIQDYDDIQSYEFSKLSQLKALYIYDSNIKILPEEIPKCKNITNLVLMRSKIDNVTNISKLSNLEVLDLRGNNLSDVSELEKLTKLNFVVLMQNNLNNIPEGLKKIKNLILD